MDWEAEKSALQKKAEDAAAALKSVAEELAGLKQQINAMTFVVFGKYPHMKLFQFILSHQWSVY